MKLIIDIPEDYFETIKHEVGWNNVKPYNLIANGIPLDNLRAEIEFMDFDFGDYYDHTDEIIDKVCKVIDKYKAESEDKK